jgi:putative restriction endonuclease
LQPRSASSNPSLQCAKISKDDLMLESLKQLAGGAIHLPRRAKDRPDRDRLAPRFERFKALV